MGTYLNVSFSEVSAMKVNKCRHCGLVNAAHDTFCRRCDDELGVKGRNGEVLRGPRAAAKSSSWFYTILFLGLVCAAAAYLFTGVEKSYDEIRSNDANRIATEHKDNPTGLSRTQYDQKRAGQYGNAIQNSPGLATSQKHNEEIKQLMQPAANKTAK